MSQDDIKVKDMPALVRRGAGIINTDQLEYRNAILRRDRARATKELERRVSAIESNIEKILHILSGAKNGTN